MNAAGTQGIDQAQIKNMVSHHIQQKVMVIDDVDRQVWEAVSNVPYVSKVVAVIAAVLNFIFPGFGTMVAACAAQDSVSKTQLVMALIQFLTSVVLIGWFLSLYWGYLIVKKAWENENMMQMPTGHPGGYQADMNPRGHFDGGEMQSFPFNGIRQ